MWKSTITPSTSTGAKMKHLTEFFKEHLRLNENHPYIVLTRLRLVGASGTISAWETGDGAGPGRTSSWPGVFAARSVACETDETACPGGAPVKFACRMAQWHAAMRVALLSSRWAIAMIFYNKLKHTNASKLKTKLGYGWAGFYWRLSFDNVT